MADAHVHHDGCTYRQAYANDEAEHPFCSFIFDPCIKPFPCTTSKPHLLVILSAECLDNAERSQTSCTIEAAELSSVVTLCANLRR